MDTQEYKDYLEELKKIPRTEWELMEWYDENGVLRQRWTPPIIFTGQTYERPPVSDEDDVMVPF